MRHLPIALAVAVLALLAAAGPASAATAKVVQESEEDQLTTTIVLNASPGERNDLVVRAGDETDDGAATVVFRERRAKITAGKGCEADGAKQVTCTDIAGDFHAVEVDAGNGNDRVDARGLSLTDFSVSLRGGTGNDRVTGSKTLENTIFGDDDVSRRGGNDVLIGGDEKDFIDAGAGNDKIVAGGGTDDVNCGSGRDTVRASRSDKRRRCEVFKRG